MLKQLIFILLISISASAELIELKAKINFKPEKSIGIIFDTAGAKYFNQTNVNEIKSGETIISFRASDFAEGSFASALIMGKEGEIAFASVQQLSKTQESEILNLPKCQEPVSDDFSQQKGLLEELVSLRTQRQVLLKKKLKQYLDNDFVTELLALEKKYGIQEIEVITANTSPEVLNLRLFRLINAIK